MAAFRAHRCGGIACVALGVALLAPPPAQTDCLGFAHTPLGNAQLSCGPDGLLVSGIGMEGGDGVSIDVTGRVPEGYDLEIGTPSLDADQSPPIGAFLEFRALGSFNGLPGQAVSIARFEVTGPGAIGTTYDLRPLNPESMTVNVFEDGSFRQQVTGFEPYLFGELGGLSKPKVSLTPVNCGGDFVADLDQASYHDGAGNVLKLDGGRYHLVFVGQNPLFDLTDFSAATIVAGGGLKEFLITSEEVALTPVPCYPDFTGDGTLDLFDFLGYVNSFNTADPRADCDHNGGLDLFDFLCFVNAFNAGC